MLTSCARLIVLTFAAASCLGFVPAHARQQPGAASGPRPPTAPSNPKSDAAERAARIADAAAKSSQLLLRMQETLDGAETKAEWPYEGVYRVKGEIPIGYRIGGTAICADALLRLPGYDASAAGKDAVARAAQFICTQIKHPLMNPETYDGGYDVRGWGYTCALAFLLDLRAAKAVPQDPPGLAASVDDTIRWCIDALNKTEIPKAGGWNYARSPGRETVSPCSPFMTGPTLQALFDAKRQRFDVDDAVIARALDSLERCRSDAGSFSYSVGETRGAAEPTPGAVGRMLVGECTLHLAGRADLSRVRGAIDAFLTHWQWLDQRRAKPGTHVGPYAIAPYYFYYAHYYAAQAIELLPAAERAEYRRRLTDLIFAVRQDDGSWNDRVFPRTANFGTAMSAMALVMPQSPTPARYSAK